MTPSPRLSAALLLVAVTGTAWYASQPGDRTPGPPSLTLSAPYAHDNLAVYVVRGPDTFDAGNVMTLQEALEKGLAVVHETGDVNTLAVENRSDDQELFLQSGDIVKGGRQDRLIASDLILPPKSGRVACPANCCEQSRWSGRGQEAATHFARSTDFAGGNGLRIANATGQQPAVWENVAKAQKDLSENVGKSVNAPESPTSLQLALENKDLRAKLAGYEKALAGVANYPDAVGVVVAVNGQVIAADVYGSAKLFKKVWPKLLKAAAADALAQMPAGGAVPPAPSARQAEEFLASAAAGAADHPATRPGSDEVMINAANFNPVGNRLLIQNPFAADNVEGRVTRAALQGQAPAQVAGNASVVVLGDEALPAAIPQPQPRPPAAGGQGGVVVVGSQAPSQPSVTVHRSYLKK